MQQPTLELELTTEDGKPGWIIEFYSHDENDQPLPTPATTLHIQETRMFFADTIVDGLTERFTVKLKGKLVPREKDQKYNFGLSVLGRSKLFVDGNLVIDNWTRQIRGNSKPSAFISFPSPR